jgi:FkbM family methyltransferase
MKKYIYYLINRLGYRIENRQNIIDREMIYLSKFNVAENVGLLLKSSFFIRKIDAYFEDLKIEDYENGLILIFNKLKIFVESSEEVYIVCEVFVENEYNIFRQSSSVIIDIGANIGIASLFFSTLDFVEKIYAFEPVLETFEQAKYNLSLNQNISKVHQFYNFGLGKDNRDETFFFNKNMKGNTGVRGLLSPSYANQNLNLLNKVDVKIRDASEIISAIREENLDKKIIVKMDCEGAEYEIFENLKKSGTLNFIDVIMLEWHDKGAKDIEIKLENSGFNYFSRNLGPNSGMIYAFKI